MSDKDKKSNKIPTEPQKYEFDKHTFIVEPVFKENATDTVGTILLRMIKNDKDNK